MASYQHISHGFDPVFDEHSRILVLGSFPSVLSRKNAFYYGNPQNRFWRVMATCLGQPVPPNEGEARGTAAAAPANPSTNAFATSAVGKSQPATMPQGLHPTTLQASEGEPNVPQSLRPMAPRAGERKPFTPRGPHPVTLQTSEGEPAAPRASETADGPVTLEESIAAKKRLLLDGGIALWDVIESCDIKGSSDASIKNVVPAQVERVLETAHIGAVICNGGTAGQLYKRYLQWQVGLAAHVLPSTSPANASWGLDRLCERWREELAPLLAAAADGTLGEAPSPSSIKRSFVTAKVQVGKTGSEHGPASFHSADVETDTNKNDNPHTRKSGANEEVDDAPRRENPAAKNAANNPENTLRKMKPGANRRIMRNATANAPSGSITSGMQSADSSTQSSTDAQNAQATSGTGNPGIEYTTVRVESPAASSWSVHKSMQGNKRANTKPELLVRERLRAAGLGGYRLQWKVPGHPDIAWPGKRVAIEVRGCFWHRCPHCNPSTPKKNVEYWQAKFARNIERDADNLRQLQDMGWRVHIVWECQLKKRTIDATMAELLPELATELGKELRSQPVTDAEKTVGGCPARPKTSPADAYSNEANHDEHAANPVGNGDDTLPPKTGSNTEEPRARKKATDASRTRKVERDVSQPHETERGVSQPHEAERVAPAAVPAPSGASKQAATPQPHFMYVIECADGSLYTGYTTDVEARFARHQAGTGAKYTRGRGPLNLLAVAEFATKHDAMSAEYRFKRLTRDQKDELLAKAAKPNITFADVLRKALER